jgi:hypothetical protein
VLPISSSSRGAGLWTSSTRPTTWVLQGR